MHFCALLITKRFCEEENYLKNINCPQLSDDISYHSRLMMIFQVETCHEVL